MPDTFILRDWQSLYFLTGTAAATFIGLIFVAVSLGSRLVPGQERSIQAFVTPTVAHFGLSLIFSILALVPTYTMLTLGLMLVGVGLAGVGYCVSVTRQIKLHHMAQQEQQLPQQGLNLNHLIWHLFVPVSSYLLIIGVGLGLLFEQGWLLNLLVVGMVGLLVTGLHNAYDLILWIARQPG